ncbi:hypothetical protein FOMPIDRAFT_41926 [Fomitopsis schrenkii]|uniref:DUF2828 domain-containing protein n=1 Tax=Fomitopsis schrenkii TaxID=2126942 RepID=S8E4R4_FOMSC|nr:hypothetical protein FOMPIDRAFT_41926 [Fomitopsis schrenkii]
MDALKATANRTFTENGAPAYSSTTSPLLDAFQELRPHVHGDNISPLLESAWKQDPELTLRIIWNARSIHDGKGEREVFYQAFGWLYEHHPRTAIENLPRLVEPLCTRPRKSEAMPHGYWKDLLNIVALAALDELRPWIKTPTFLCAPKGHPYVPDAGDEKRVDRNRLRGGRGKARRWLHSVPAKGPQLTKVQRADAHHARLEEKLQVPKFRALYVMVARLFAEKLAQDVATLDQLEAAAKGSEERQSLSWRLSLVGKWAPSPQGSHDRVTNLSTAICLLLHDAGVSSCLRVAVPRDTPAPALETHVLRSYFQRWVLSPLRRALAVPEPLMSAGRWKEINYSRVASLCMKSNMVLFYKHDPEGFEAFVTKVEGGNKKISGATLMPHKIVEAVQGVGYYERLSEELSDKLREIQLRVLDAQWASLVERLREAGRLDSALAVCDVSGSMSGEPINVSLALSLVTAQLAKPPFSNGFITFSQNPQFQLVDVEKNGLAGTLGDMMQSQWDMNTDLHAVFVKLLLPLAVENKVKPEDMIKTLFVFSDMQFDDATDQNASWETNHDAIEREYKEAGYEVPQIVYWDLAAHDVRGPGLSAIPVTSDKKGVALMNGFSPAMLKVFMGDAEASEDVASDLGDGWEKVEDGSQASNEEEEDFTPLNVMKKAVMKASFDGLVVVD